MRKVQSSNKKSNAGTRTNGKAHFGHEAGDEVESSATRTEPKSWNTCLVWCYHLSTEWILLHLVGNTSKQEDRKPDNVITTPCRVDSGVGLDVLGQDDGNPSHTAASTPPASITLLFRFDDGTTIKHVSHPVFSTWSAINTLFSELALDGIIVHELWDMQEDMQIGSGDWDARIQPGSAIEARCFNDKRSYHSDDFHDSSDCESDDEMVESDEDGHDTGSEYRMSWKTSAKDTRNEHTWWFTRWRQRVEKVIPGRHEVTDEPPWLFIVIWCTTTITIIALLILLNQ